MQSNHPTGDRSDLSNLSKSQHSFVVTPPIREKLKKLARWRIPRSAIKCLEGHDDLGGANAVVTKAIMNPPSRTNVQSNKATEVAEGDQLSGIGRLHTELGEDSIRKPQDISSADQSSSNQRLPAAEKFVAVKKLTVPKGSSLEQVFGLGLRESEFLVELSHPNIIQLEGFAEDTTDGTLWLVFPWEQNGNLKAFLTSQEWEIPERISLIHDVIKGVEYLHSREPPICHGDLKSFNILVTERCTAIITDFGSARHLKGEGGHKKPEDDDHMPPSEMYATTGQEKAAESFKPITLIGSKYTLRWAAPELLNGNDSSRSSDIWALGWIAYEVMTNEYPYHDAIQNHIVMARVVMGRFPVITDHARMSLIRDLCSLMFQCWKMEFCERPTAEVCRKLVSWMPMITPVPRKSDDELHSQTLSPQLLAKIGFMYNRQGDYHNASKSYVEALQAYRGTGNVEGEAEALSGLGDVDRYRGKLEEAVTSYSKALQVTTNSGAQSTRGSALCGLGEIYRLQRKDDAAIEHYEKSIHVFTSLKNRRGQASALWGLAEVRRKQGQDKEALALLSESLQIRTEIGDRQGRADALWSFATIYRRRNEYPKAIESFMESLDISRDLGDRYGVAHTLLALAQVHRQREDFYQAICFYSDALAAFTTINDKKEKGRVLLGLGDMHRACNKLYEATEFYGKALETYAEQWDQRRMSEIMLRVAEVLQERGQQVEAMSFSREAAKMYGQIGH